MSKMQTQKRFSKGKGIPLNAAMLLMVLLPLIFSILIISVILIAHSKKITNDNTFTLMHTAVLYKGQSFEDEVTSCSDILDSFSESDLVVNLLRHPDGIAAREQAQSYVERFTESLDGWESVYIADWTSKTLAHHDKNMIGVVTRTGDDLKGKQEAMLATDGVYNTGIIVSPATGEYVVSMYKAVYDKGKPIGYVGGAVNIAYVADKYDDVSELNIPSAYNYIVSKDGVYVWHKDPSWIGREPTTDYMNDLLARIRSGEHPEPDCISYHNKVDKYAAYYVSKDNGFIYVITGNKDDVMAPTNRMVAIICIAAAAVLVLFAILSIIVSRFISTSIKEAVKECDTIAMGDLSETGEAISSIKELKSLLNNMTVLREQLLSIIFGIRMTTDAHIAYCMELKEKIDPAEHDGVAPDIKAANEIVDSITASAEELKQSMDFFKI